MVVLRLHGDLEYLIPDKYDLTRHNLIGRKVNHYNKMPKRYKVIWGL